VPQIAERETLQPRHNDPTQHGYIFVGRNSRRVQAPEKRFIACLQEPNRFKGDFCQWYVFQRTLILDGKSRITLTDEQNAPDLQEPADNVLGVLFQDDSKREEVRRIAFDAFKRYFVVDPTKMGKLRIGYSDVLPSSLQHERGLHKEAVDFHKNAEDISDASDGVKAFTGIITQIIAGDPSIILIDEPEAFLHPALSSKLGKEIANSASNTDKRVFISTHSANFVMGCMQSDAPTNITRLTYQNGVATARTLPGEELLRMMRHPLLRSIGVLNGLFYESVIVTEGDSDRAFYQEINERLLRFAPDRGIPNCLFLNALGKDTIDLIVGTLRRLGIPAAGIVDIDILKNGGNEWKKFLKGCSIPEASREGFGSTRASVFRKCDESNRDMKRDGGVEILDRSDREAADKLFNQLDEYGLFTVRSGELESWLKHLGAGGHGPKWLINVFEKMGEDSNDANYARPQDGDVWDFVESVGKWLKNPDRDGIPA